LAFPQFIRHKAVEKLNNAFCKVYPTEHTFSSPVNYFFISLTKPDNEIIIYSPVFLNNRQEIAL